MVPWWRIRCSVSCCGVYLFLISQRIYYTLQYLSNSPFSPCFRICHPLYQYLSSCLRINVHLHILFSTYFHVVIYYIFIYPSNYNFVFTCLFAYSYIKMFAYRFIISMYVHMYPSTCLYIFAFSYLPEVVYQPICQYANMSTFNIHFCLFHTDVESGSLELIIFLHKFEQISSLVWSVCQRAGGRDGRTGRCISMGLDA